MGSCSRASVYTFLCVEQDWTGKYEEKKNLSKLTCVLVEVMGVHVNIAIYVYIWNKYKKIKRVYENNFTI